MTIDRARLAQVRAAIDGLLSLDEAAFGLLEHLVAAKPKGNGVDHQPPALASSPIPAPSPAPVPAKQRRDASKRPRGKGSRPSPEQVAAAEDALLATMRAHPGAGVNELARVTGSRPNTVGERLKRMEARGAAHKVDGKWRVAEAASPHPRKPAAAPATMTSS